MSTTGQACPVVDMNISLSIEDNQADIHVNNMTSLSCKVICVVKNIRQLFIEHLVSKIVSLVCWMAVQKERNIVCCAVVVVGAIANALVLSCAGCWFDCSWRLSSYEIFGEIAPMI